MVKQQIQYDLNDGRFNKYLNWSFYDVDEYYINDVGNEDFGINKVRNSVMKMNGLK